MNNKKWISIIVALTYWIILLTAATWVMYLIMSTQASSWSWERFNMAYYAAEWWREQALFESNVHWIWFSWWIALTQLLYLRTEYEWSTVWRKYWVQSWYLVIWDNTNKISFLDQDLWHYIYSRRINLYYDGWATWSWRNFRNECINFSNIEVNFSISWSNISVPESKRIVYWKINMKDGNENWTWYVLQPEETCTWWNVFNTNPFCYQLSSGITNYWNNKLYDSSKWLCKDDYWNKCILPFDESASIKDFLTNTSIVSSPYNPTLLLSYVYPLNDSITPIEYFPIRYEVTWSNIQNCQFPTLVKNLKWIWKTNWAIVEVTAKVSQEEWLTVFDYAIIQ